MIALLAVATFLACPISTILFRGPEHVTPNNVLLQLVVIAVDDLDGDKASDFVCAYTVRAGALDRVDSSLLAVSGKSGSVIWRSSPLRASPGYGTSICTASQGLDSLLYVGIPDQDAVECRELATGRLRHTLTTSAKEVGFGTALLVLGGADRNIDRIMISAPWAAHGRDTDATFLRTYWAGSEAVIASAQLKHLGTGDERRYSLPGMALAQLGDLDGDGRHDVLVGSPGFRVDSHAIGRVDVLSGATLAQIEGHSVLGVDPGGKFGACFLVLNGGAAGVKPSVWISTMDRRVDLFLLGTQDAIRSVRSKGGVVYRDGFGSQLVSLASQGSNGVNGIGVSAVDSEWRFFDREYSPYFVAYFGDDKKRTWELETQSAGFVVCQGWIGLDRSKVVLVPRALPLQIIEIESATGSETRRIRVRD